MKTHTQITENSLKAHGEITENSERTHNDSRAPAERNGTELTASHDDDTSTEDPIIIISRERAFEELKLRGVQPKIAYETLDRLSPQVVMDTLSWYDHHSKGNSKFTAGTLVVVLRDGGKPGWKRASVADGQREYAYQIVAWLKKNFPEFDRPDWGVHPAAVAAVIRLHHRVGRGNLTKAKHGGEVRAAVSAWDAISDLNGGPL